MRARSCALALGLVGTASVGACSGTTPSELLAAASGSHDAADGTDALASSDGAVLPSDAARDAVTTDAPLPSDAAVDVSVRVDLACPPTSSTPTTCDLRFEACCRTATAFTCRPQTGTCNGIRILCAQQSDCEYRYPGQGNVCCAELNQETHVTNVGCAIAGQCGTEDSRVIVCNPNDADPCPEGGTCQASQGTLVGFFICK